MTFDSYYWHEADVASVELGRARARLAEAGDPAAFALLLGSTDPVAVGVALDQYHRSEAFTRHGTANAFADYADDVVARAREILRGPPSGPECGAEPGANHASALGALMNLAEPDDAGLIADALNRTRTANLQFAASLAAGAALEKSVSPHHGLIAGLEQVVLDMDAVLDARSGALAALGRSLCARATQALMRATNVPNIRLQATAALHLLDRDPEAHRSHVLELTLTWPDDPPYPAPDVLELLSAVPEDR
jgi:hypothetical protein